MTSRAIRCELSGLPSEMENAVHRDEYWEAVRSRVCRTCGDGDGKGGCSISHTRECAIRTYFPLIVNAVNRVSSDRVEDYVSELKGIVCAQCTSETVDGRCALRTEAACAFDLFFPLIIETIVEVQRRLGA